MTSQPTPPASEDVHQAAAQLYDSLPGAINRDARLDAAVDLVAQLTEQRVHARDVRRIAELTARAETAETRTLDAVHQWLVQQRDRHMVGSERWWPLDELCQAWAAAHLKGGTAATHPCGMPDLFATGDPDVPGELRCGTCGTHVQPHEQPNTR